ncbi:MAG: DUF3047 domain-containing protein [Desulfobacteraceae bacterium]
MELTMKVAMGVLFLLVLLCSLAGAGEVNLFREEFNDLENWRELTFKKIERASTYAAEKGILIAESDASASGLIYGKSFDVYAHPMAAWRWKVNNVYMTGNAEKKSGDDYPLRVYIVFQYNPETAGFAKSIKYKAVRLLYGKYPPDSSLNYVWANRKQKKRIMTSPYTDQSRMVLLQAGEEKIGRWVEEEVNILEDYRAAFGKNPPARASVAIMNDSDNTGEGSRSYLDFIRIYRKAP